jgi:hypothetical protein
MSVAARGAAMAMVVITLIFAPIVKNHHITGYKQVGKTTVSKQVVCGPAIPGWDPHSQSCTTPAHKTVKVYKKATVTICKANQVYLHGRCVTKRHK